MTYDPHNYDPSNLEQLNLTKPNYLAAYGLTEAPFSKQHDDRFFYSHAALTERFESLNHYMQNENLLLIITGVRGSGKSSLKQHFMNTAAEDWQVSGIQAHTMMDASLLLRQAAVDFGITDPPLEPSWLYEILNDQLIQLHHESTLPVLIIDDAHELPQDALQAILHLAEHHSNQETALRIILLCEPQIETMLEDHALLSLKERVTHYMEIPALDETQTAEYLRHRLAVAGLDSTSPFTPKVIHKIFKASEGLPSKINEYAHQNLFDDSEPDSPEESNLDNELYHEETSFNFRNMLLGGFALIIVITVLLFQDRINKLFEEPKRSSNTTEVKQNQNKDIKAVPQTITETAKNIPDALASKDKLIEFSLTKEPVEKIIAPVKQPKNIIKNSIVLKLSSVKTSPVFASKQRQIISINGSGFHNKQKVKVSWTGNEKILSSTQVNVASDTDINLTLNVGTQEDTWNVTIIDPVHKIESNTISFDVIASETISKQKKTTSNAVIKKSNNTSDLYGQSWIKQQNKNHFTLQLLGTHQKSTLPLYLEKFNLKNNAAIFKTKRNGEDWFTLIYGHYPTKSAAQTAAQQLPKGMSPPWIRSFASVQPSLDKNSATNRVLKTVAANQDGWLWSQDPSHYTLQLAAGTDKEAIQTFINKHNLDGKAVYFHRLRDGNNWYTLIHSSYPTYDKAKEAIKQLPLAVQKAKPWVRQFKAIHMELN